MNGKVRLLTAAMVAATAALATLFTGAPAQAAYPEQAAVPTTVIATRWPSPYGTLSGIAAVRCHDASRWPQLARANRITAPYWLYPGQRITVACVGTAGGNAPAPAPSGTTATGWVSPLPGAPCVSGWGDWRPGHTHKGIDLVRGAGAPIHAAHAGTVTLVRWQSSAGWYVMLNHGTTQTVYMHMVRRSFLAVGAQVSAGQTIGYVGATGDASGDHLHFEIHNGRWTGNFWTQINPAPFLRSHGVKVGC